MKALDNVYDTPVTMQGILQSKETDDVEHPAVLLGLTAVANVRHKGILKTWGCRIWKQNKETRELECPKSMLTRVQSIPDKKINTRELVVDILAIHDKQRGYWQYAELKFPKE